MDRDEEEMGEDEAMLRCIAEAFGAVADLCTRMNLTGFALFKCDVCPDWHCGVCSTGTKTFGHHRGTSGDPKYAALDMIMSLLTAAEKMGEALPPASVEKLSEAILRQLSDVPIAPESDRSEEGDSPKGETK